MDFKKETISIGWCDGGTPDGKFTQGLVHTLINMQAQGFPVTNAIRVQGNQIARQRESLLKQWYESKMSDWLLWVDSDIVLTIDIVKMLVSIADKKEKPIVSGIYFISKQPEGELTMPFPVIFNDIDEFTIQHIHPLPLNEVIPVDCAGMGLVLMHRSVVDKMKSVYGNEALFQEIAQTNNDDKFIGEDVVFFRKVKKAGIQLYAHTGAIAQHMKRYAFDYNHYSMWWNTWDRYQAELKLKEEQNKQQEIKTGTV